MSSFVNFWCHIFHKTSTYVATKTFRYTCKPQNKLTRKTLCSFESGKKCLLAKKLLSIKEIIASQQFSKI